MSELGVLFLDKDLQKLVFFSQNDRTMTDQAKYFDGLTGELCL